MPHFSLNLSFNEIVVNVLLALLLIVLIALLAWRIVKKSNRLQASLTLENFDKLATILLKLAIILGIGVIGASYYLQSQNGRYQMIKGGYDSDVFIIDTRTGDTKLQYPR
jgi:hypothetical protein